MKSQFFFIAIIVLFISNSLTAQNFDFRKTRWGMDSTQVKKAETAKLVLSKKNYLLYSGKLSTWDTKIIYNFTKTNMLYHAVYLVDLDSKNPQTYVNAFLLLQELLTENYKQPYDKKNATINGKVISEDEWASNLISDNLNLETKWKTDRTNIDLSLFSISDDLYLEINYTSIENEKNMSEEKRKELLNEL